MRTPAADRGRTLLVILAVVLAEPGCGKPPGSRGRSGPAWIQRPPGTLRMGAPPTESCRGARELRPEEVEIGHGLEVSAYEVTQAEFAAAMGYDPSFNAGCPECPVESVSWHEAAAYCVGLDARLGTAQACYACEGDGAEVRCTPVAGCSGHRLPTEAEWEYLARAGTKTPTYAGRVTSCMSSDEVAHRIGWYKSNSEGQTHPVGEKAPNPWGLHDTAGNVYEWTEQLGAEGERVLKGGSWYHNAHHLRAAARLFAPAQERLSYAGIRCVRTVAHDSAR